MQKVTKLLLFLLMLPFVFASAASNKKVSEKRNVGLPYGVPS